MRHLSLQTEYSFRECFGKIDDIAKYIADLGHDSAGIADLNNTYGHVPWAKACKKYGIKPIFGVRLNLVQREDDRKNEVRRCNVPIVIVAKNESGLNQIYRLTKRAYDNFYYIPRIYADDIEDISGSLNYAGDVFISYPSYPITFSIAPYTRGMQPCNRDFLALDNRYSRPIDRESYEIIAGAHKRGDSYIHNFSSASYPQHILTDDEVNYYFGRHEFPEHNEPQAEMCNVTLPQAPMTKYTGSRNLELVCWDRLHEYLEFDIPLNEMEAEVFDKYEERLTYEIKMIKEKNYVDYFMITADMVKEAKRTMLVGPSRGSSAGSLVCFLLGITEIDPLKYDLLFERFIDINRFDLPDIDIDFPDSKRSKVLKYLRGTYGSQNVAALGTVNTLKPKSALNEFAMGLSIPKYDLEEVKGAIIERSSGDARAAMCISDTFDTTEPGKAFIEQYPKMRIVGNAEEHAVHTGKHAAGIIVCDKPITTYGGVNTRESDIIMMDKKSAEELGLLKIDVLGLRTLSIIEEVCDRIGWRYDEIYNLPLDDTSIFSLFNNMRLNGIFQFEGQALRILTKQMGVHEFNDIVAITALARPGALNSGGAMRYVKNRTGQEEPFYYNELHKEITAETYGVTVYQEQMMRIAKEIGQLSWDEVQQLRRAASKSLGDEFFGTYKEIFMEGALKSLDEEKATELWHDISYSGSWTFNKSHAVSYGLISYWTAYLKYHYPLDFAVANLNHARDVQSGVKLLRDFVKNEGFEYIAVDPDESDVYWSVHEGKLLGGLINIHGIGEAKAENIRAGRLTPGLLKKLENPTTDYDILFPADHYWGGLYRDPRSYDIPNPPSFIEDVGEPGEYWIIGCLIDRNMRDLNEYVFLTKRGGEIIEEDNLYLLFTVEDDTDSIMCKINRWDYEEMGKPIAEQGKIGESWYLIKGKINSTAWRKLDVTAIVNLEEWLGDKDAITG